MENITLGQIYQFMAFAATFIGTAIVVVKYAISAVSKVVDMKINPIIEDNKKIHQELKQNSLDTMRIAICSDELPLKERVDIGRRYITAGGNGSVKVLVHELEDKYAKQLREGGKI